MANYQPRFEDTSRTRSIVFQSALIASLVIGAIGWVSWSRTASAQTPAPEFSPAATAETAAKVVRWTGTLPEFAGKTVDIQFGLYENAAGGLALWNETQRVTVGADGRYSVLLGATSNEGLPQTLFPTGVGRWVAAHPVSGSKAEPETRSLLAAVPYAFKAVDAETLAGRSAADYVTREDLKAASTVPVLNSPNALSIQSNLAVPNLAGTGSPNYLPIWTNSTTLGNSTIYEISSKVGIGLTSPATTLDVNGTTTLRGTTYLPTLGSATTSTGYGSRALQFNASSYSSSNATAIAQAFQFQALPVGNNTASPSANLSLLYGIGSSVPKATGLSFGANGLITFAAGQKFPGTGTITAITTTSPLSGSGTSGSVSISLNTTTLESTLDGKYPQLATANNFTSTSNNNFAGPITANSTPANQFAVHGFTTTGYGVQGFATGLGGIGTSGYSTANAGIGLYGLVTGGLNGSNAPVAVLGHASTGYAVEGVATGTGGVGILGLNNTSLSPIGQSEGANGVNPAIWGDSNPSSSHSFSPAFLATTEDQQAAVLFNNSTSSQTLYVFNLTTSGPGTVAEFVGHEGGCSFDTNGSFTCDGTKSAAVPVDNNTRKVALYAMESPENWFEDFGTGQLANGATVIKFEPTFAQTVNAGMEYHVFLTPKGDCKGLFVTNETPQGFEVRELGSGRSSIAFDYRIVARRKGYETIRLADKTKDRDFSKSPAMKLMEASQTAR